MDMSLRNWVAAYWMRMMASILIVSGKQQRGFFIGFWAAAMSGLLRGSFCLITSRSRLSTVHG
jgi:hypothetical protein